MFSYEGYADHRDLPSFPTRRASDLGPQRPIELHALRDRVPEQPGQPPAAADRMVLALLLAQRLQRGRSGRGDRKSTRLNSSHANIPYAGFCLKTNRPATDTYAPARC